MTSNDHHQADEEILEKQNSIVSEQELEKGTVNSIRKAKIYTFQND